jgi:glycosyltransferase involved in cell wall biosynthesis
MPDLNWVKTIYNGIDVGKFTVGKKEDRKYFAFLGRVSPEKGLKEICEVIKKDKA